MHSTKTTVASNIQNRSPWQVTVRNNTKRNAQFPFNKEDDATAYLAEMKRLDFKASLKQLETSFQLRVRRQGVKQQFITFDTREAAEQARLHIEANLSVSIVRDYAAATRHTLCDLMQRYVEEVAPSHKGGDIEAGRLRRLMRDETFVDKKLAALTTEDLQDYITDRLTEVAPATVDRDLDVISQVLRYADDVWKIAPSESPFKGLRRPSYFNERDRRLSAEEEAKLLKAARADENTYVEAAIILALETAMRRSELLGVTPADINYERRYAFLRDTKNGRSRKVPLSMRAMEVLQALPANDGQPLLNLSANALKIAFFRRVLPASGIAELHFHDLRHEAISRFAESGRFQLIELQAISGHRDMRMLQRYAHLCSGNLAEKMDSISSGSVKKYLHRGRKRKVIVKDKDAIATGSAVQPSVQSQSHNLPDNVIAFDSRKRMAA